MPPRSQPRTLPDVVADGDHRASLEALRDTLARSLSVAEPNNVASLAKQLQAVLRELADLPPPKTETTPVDDLTAKRVARRSAAAGTGGAGVGDVGRPGGRRAR
jgi:hypothetical protein